MACNIIVQTKRSKTCENNTCLSFSALLYKSCLKCLISPFTVKRSRRKGKIRIIFHQMYLDDFIFISSFTGVKYDYTIFTLIKEMCCQYILFALAFLAISGMLFLNMECKIHRITMEEKR